MKKNKRLEQFLFQLEKHLSDLSPSDRSKIIIDINEHIEQAIEKYSDKNVEEILKDLGKPQAVANHYRLDRGLKTFKAERSPVWKWLSITFLGSLGLFLIFLLIMVWKFTPLFEINEKEQRVTILGGMIDINATSGKIKIMDEYKFVDNKFTNKFDGAVDFSRQDFDELVINFKSGVINLNTSAEEKLSWNCKLQVAPNDEFIERSKNIMIIDLESYEGVDCDIKVPADTKLTIDGKDAQITVNDPEYDTYIELKNGQVYFNYNPEVDYNYDLKTKNGKVSSEFVSSSSKGAYEVKIYLENGTIDKN